MLSLILLILLIVFMLAETVRAILAVSALLARLRSLRVSRKILTPLKIITRLHSPNDNQEIHNIFGTLEIGHCPFLRSMHLGIQQKLLEERGNPLGVVQINGTDFQLVLA